MSYYALNLIADQKTVKAYLYIGNGIDKSNLPSDEPFCIYNLGDDNQTLVVVHRNHRYLVPPISSVIVDPSVSSHVSVVSLTGNLFTAIVISAYGSSISDIVNSIGSSGQNIYDLSPTDPAFYFTDYGGDHNTYISINSSYLTIDDDLKKALRPNVEINLWMLPAGYGYYEEGSDVPSYACTFLTAVRGNAERRVATSDGNERLMNFIPEGGTETPYVKVSDGLFTKPSYRLLARTDCLLLTTTFSLN